VVEVVDELRRVRPFGDRLLADLHARERGAQPCGQLGHRLEGDVASGGRDADDLGEQAALVGADVDGAVVMAQRGGADQGEALVVACVAPRLGRGERPQRPQALLLAGGARGGEEAAAHAAIVRRPAPRNVAPRAERP
jgi:hypothetical protein